jgi:hypothetical protein
MVKPGGRVFLSTPDGTFGTGGNPHHLHAYRTVDFMDIVRHRGRDRRRAATLLILVALDADLGFRVERSHGPERAHEYAEQLAPPGEFVGRLEGQDRAELHALR